MNRTVYASVVAGVIALVVVGGLGMFLGFGATGSWITGAVFGILSGLLIWGAARRADSFHGDQHPGTARGGVPDSDPRGPSRD